MAKGQAFGVKGVRGHVVTRMKKRVKPSQRKGNLGTKTKLVR